VCDMRFLVNFLNIWDTSNNLFPSCLIDVSSYFLTFLGYLYLLLRGYTCVMCVSTNNNIYLITSGCFIQPSKTKLAEVTFSDRVEDLPDPVAVGSFLPERRKLLEVF
jgi:hypothetical protein